ncbi:MAG: protein kinase [Patescibacteria group bacterium]
MHFCNEHHYKPTKEAVVANENALEIGTVVDGRYRVEKKIGAGGMATVYRVHDIRLDKPCAMKVLNAALAMHGKAREGFFKEARIIAKMAHPNIVRVLDVHDNGMCYIVMDLIDGVSARELMNDGPMPPEVALYILDGVLAGLHAGHEHKPPIIHRDIKPDNVLVVRSGGVIVKVVIIDYGVAHFREDEQDGQSEMTNAPMGTAPYMAPEQRRGGKDVDRRTDLFEAGAMLWALLKGQSPKDIVFAGRDPEMLADIPEDVAKIILRAVEYDMAKRYPTAAAMRADVLKAMEALRATSETVQPRSVLHGRTVKWRAVGMLAAVVMLAVGGVTWWQKPEVDQERGEAGQELSGSVSGTDPLTNRPTDPPLVVPVQTETPKPAEPIAPVVMKPEPKVVKPPKAEAPVVIAPDTSPRIVHKTVKKARAGDVIITADVKNVGPMKMWLYSRTKGTTKWDSVAMRAGDKGYQASLTATTQSVEYYVSVEPEEGDTLQSGNRQNPHVIVVTP